MSVWALTKSSRGSAAQGRWDRTHNDMPCPPKADKNTFRPRKKFCEHSSGVR